MKAVSVKCWNVRDIIIGKVVIDTDDNYYFESLEEKRKREIYGRRLYSICVGASLHGCVLLNLPYIQFVLNNP